MKTGSEAETILVVDDDPESLMVYSEILSDSGYRVIAQTDGASALAAVQEVSSIDLVITGYRMPDMSGFVLIEELRKVMPAVQTIMLTEHGNIEMYFRSRDLGVFEFVNKPVRKTEFERIVRAAIEKSRTTASC
ncbi:MAG TPA: response regulator [Nitrospirota bacterium]|nr:response regulator [Nitrospirota bacterium]